MKPVLMLQTAALLTTLTIQDPAERLPVARDPAPPGVFLADLKWPEAEARLGPDTVVVLPLGGTAVEHGHHLALGADATLAGYLARRLAAAVPVVVAPPVTYTHEPAFADYPGSTSISLAAERDTIADVARSLARFGPRRFYVAHVRRTDVPALTETAALLARDGILLRFADVRGLLDTTVRRLSLGTGDGHADEIETSMMLHVEPSAVDLTRAVRENRPASRPLRLARQPGVTYSASGSLGDPAAATREKGRALADALVAGMVDDIDALRRATPPPPGSRMPASAARSASSGDRLGRLPDECLAGDDRAIRAIGPAFFVAWMKHDAPGIAGLWTDEGDMVHPDGVVEGSARVIRVNRAALFARPAYTRSRHSLQFGDIRCITADVAIADGKWDLWGVTDDRGGSAAPVDGLFTLVLRKSRGAWRIEAYRYSMNPRLAAGPALLSRPGAPEAIR